MHMTSKHSNQKRYKYRSPQVACVTASAPLSVALEEPW